MPSFTLAQKQRYRITLDLNVLGDFNPHEIDWQKLLDIQGTESLDTYVEDLSTPIEWH
jgi:hypothetical protein|tara:strand:+ start:1615 stop:1788 length:174 start_codon:yes stop_codon:yes gene_type:complete